MATSNIGRILSLPASADLSAKQFYAMGIASDGEAEVATAAAKIVGILQNKPDAVGKACSIQTDSISKFVAGTGGVTAGDELEVEAGGALITLSAGISVGFALETVAAAGIGSALLK